MDNNFAVFILSHGRAGNVKTYQTLINQGYTGKIYIIIDDEDDMRNSYIDKYGEDIVRVFSKKDAAVLVDTADLEPELKGVIYARNYCHTIAEEMGLIHFLVLDDDYNLFAHRYECNGKLLSCTTKRLDDIFMAMVKFLDQTGAITVALAQGGDYIGGVDNGNFKKKLLRKAMNSFFCRTDTPFKFYGRINEDTTMYVRYGETGHLIFTTMDFMLNQGQTQKNKGGLTEMYLDSGTYVKSFYSVMYSPSCVKVAAMGDKHMRGCIIVLIGIVAHLKFSIKGGKNRKGVKRWQELVDRKKSLSRNSLKLCVRYRQHRTKFCLCSVFLIRRSMLGASEHMERLSPTFLLKREVRER